MKSISVITPCYNEEDNVRKLHSCIRDVFAKIPQYSYEHICIDNASNDKTVSILKELARKDRNLKIIVNARNFGHIRSPHHAMLEAKGDVVIILASDLQDPPELIAEFIKKWEEGYRIVLGIKTKSEESRLMYIIRSLYYGLIGRLSEIPLVQHATGFGLYDRAVMEVVRKIDDPYPYFRGMICDIGFDRAYIPYTQPKRRRGITKNNFYTLYDMAMLGITNHSRIPLRVATISGFLMSTIGFFLALGYLAAKLLFWNSFRLGTAPILIGFFLFSSVQLFFIGILGEYIGAIHTQVLKRPLVVEKERINF